MTQVIEHIRALLPDATAVLTYAQSLPAPVAKVVDAYLQEHLGFWRFEVASALDVGPMRDRQEDGVFVCNVGRSFAVIDGMGGQGSGMIATGLVINTLQACFPRVHAVDELWASASLCPLVDAFERGHQAILDSNGRYMGHGAAVAGVVIDGAWMNVAHVGDCRVYRLRQGVLELLTEDHSLINEMKQKAIDVPETVLPLTEDQIRNFANVITRCLGYGEHVDVGWSRHAIAPGDRVVLCTDGLSKAVSDEHMRSILIETESVSAQVQATTLVKAALDAETRDNVGLVVVRFPG